MIFCCQPRFTFHRLLALFVVAALCSSSALADTLGLVIHSQVHETLADGALAAHYRLSFQGENPFGRCQDIQVFWRPGSVFRPGSAWFPLPARCDAESCGVTIRVDGMVFLTLLAQVRCAGVLYQAQTIDSLHAVNAKAKNGAAPLPLAEAPVAVRPALALVPAPSHYFPQTGMTFSFHYQEATDGLDTATNDGAALLGAIDERGDFQFTPSHDESLNRRGFEATSERIIQVSERRPGGPVSTFTLNVHRSRDAFLHRKSGIMLFIGVALASAALVFFLKKQSWRR